MNQLRPKWAINGVNVVLIDYNGHPIMPSTRFNLYEAFKTANIGSDDFLLLAPKTKQHFPSLFGGRVKVRNRRISLGLEDDDFLAFALSMA